MPRPNIKSIDLKEVKPLRERWLVEPGLMSDVELPLDSQRSAHHLGAIMKGKIFGIATLHHEPRPAMAEPKAWRMQAMAVAPGLRGEGIGRLLVECASRHVVRNGGKLLWANVPVDVVDFYRAVGFEVAGDPFEGPDHGPQHRVLIKPKAR